MTGYVILGALICLAIAALGYWLGYEDGVITTREQYVNEAMDTKLKILRAAMYGHGRNH